MDEFFDVTCEYTMTREYYERFLALAIGQVVQPSVRSKRMTIGVTLMLLGVFAAVYPFFAGNESANGVLAVLGLVFGFALFYLGIKILRTTPKGQARQTSKQRFERLGLRDRTLFFGASGAGLWTRSDFHESKFSWNAVASGHLFKDGVLLVIKTDNVLWLPISGFLNADDPDVLKRLAEERGIVVLDSRAA